MDDAKQMGVGALQWNFIYKDKQQAGVSHSRGLLTPVLIY